MKEEFIPAAREYVICNGVFSYQNGMSENLEGTNQRNVIVENAMREVHVRVEFHSSLCVLHC